MNHPARLPACLPACGYLADRSTFDLCGCVCVHVRLFVCLWVRRTTMHSLHTIRHIQVTITSVRPSLMSPLTSVDMYTRRDIRERNHRGAHQPAHTTDTHA
mmetsp:Transcript_44519/g.125912  ORF Transcript_44519/g.125912 Transcript_44519/m.125912 type:complete len:101 (-) Transcript_44519:141-443(-)